MSSCVANTAEHQCPTFRFSVRANAEEIEVFMHTGHPGDGAGCVFPRDNKVLAVLLQVEAAVQEMKHTRKGDPAWYGGVRARDG